MKNCLHAFTKWIICLLAVVAINDLNAQNVRDGFCDIAIDATCGVAITNQTTVGSQNFLTKYLDCNNYTFSGPEKSYKFTTTSAGNIQVELNIAASGVDLDILLLSNDCSAPVCLAQSISSNANSKNELISYNNAPAGTYYVLVDSEKDAGAFDLMIHCNTVTPPPTGCNLEYTATPNHVSCGGSTGSIDVAIAWGKAPFKIEWDNNSGTVWDDATTSSKNYTIPNLPAGTYLVKVTDADGCVEMKNNVVITNSGSSLDANFSATDAPCGESFGWINVDVLNSSPPYWITVTGPKSGTVQGNSDNTVIKNMPPGQYEVTVEKGGCTKTGWVTVESTPNLDYVAEVSDAACGGKGSFWITIQGGSPTYTIEWWHQDGTSSWQQTTSKSFAMDNMKVGEYTIKITDRNGCWKSKKVTMGGGSLDYVVETNAASCGGKGRAWVTISGGQAPYDIEYTGPTPGWKKTSSKSFALEDLKAGSYEIVITDANGCEKEEWFTINNSGGTLDYALESNGASCGSKGSIWVTVENGAPKYTVEWWGPNVSKWATTSNKSFQLTDLGAGDYTVKITDANGCSNTKTVKVNTTGGLEFTLETLGVSCGKPGSIWMDIKNGTSKFGIDVTGPNGYSKWFSATSSKIQLTELGPGTYTVEITDANGCKGTKSINVQDLGGSLKVELEATAATCGKTGSMWVTVKDGTPKFTVELWGPNNATFWAQTNSSSFKLSELAAGDYTLKITDANGCAVTKYKTVGGGTSNMHMALEVNNAGCTSNGRIWITVTGGTPGYNLKWSGPSTGEVNMSTSGYQMNNLAAGTYTITVKDYYGCSYSETVSVYGSGGNLDLSLESNNATCSSNGYFWADITNGEGPYQVSYTGAKAGSFSVNNAGFQLSDMPAGNYSVTVKDKNGCSVTKAASIYSTGSNVDFSLEANNGSCGQNGYVWVTINSANGPYHISWTGPKTGSAASSSAGYQIGDLPSGVYAVTVKDKNGCQSTKNIEVKGGGLFTVITQQRNATCGQKGEIWIDLNGGVAPFNISLSGPVIGNILTSDYAYHFPNIPAGVYTIKVQDAAGCLVTKQVTITDSGANINIAAETNAASCGQGGSSWLTVTGGTAPYSLSWTGPVAGSATTSNGGYQLTNLPSGTYTVTATDKNGCYTNTSITINNIGNNLSLSLEATDASCGQKGAIGVTIGGGVLNFNISWTGPSSGSYVSSTAGYRIENLAAGTYTVKVKDGSGCEVSKSVTIQDGGNSIGLTLESTNASCGGKGAIWATISGGTAGYSYSWTGPSTSSVSSSSTGYRIENLVAGTYTVTVRDSKGCSATKSIVIGDDGSNIGLTLSSTNASCGGKGSIYATISGGTAGYSYSWTGPSTGSAPSSSSSYRIDNLVAGTYSITVRDSKGCSATKSVVIGDDGSNIGLTLESNSASCNGKGSIWAQISGGTAGFSYSWTGPVSGSTSTSETGYRIDNIPGGTYSVTVRDSKGCSATKSIIVQSVGGSLTVDLSTSTSVACEHDGTALIGIGGGTAPFTIAYAGPTTGSFVSNTANTQVSGLQPGDYVFNITDANGCAGSRKITIYDTGSDLSVKLTPSNASCGSKGMITVNISGGLSNYKVNWYGGGVTGNLTTGNSSVVLTDLPIGTYTVEVSDAIGCTVKETASVNDGGTGIGLQLVPTNDVCGQGGKIEVRINGGSPDYQIEWTGPVGGSATSSSSVYVIEGLTAAGNYNVIVKDANGCESKEWVAINTGGSVGFNLVPTASECNKSGNIVVNINSGSPDYTVSWAGPSSGSQVISSNFYRIEGLTQGTYAVTVKDNKGCENTSSTIVNANGKVLGLSLTNTNTSCGASNGSITARVSNGQGEYTYSWTGPVTGSATSSETYYTASNLPTGSYTISVIDKNGCNTSQSISVVNSGSDLGLTVVGKNASCGQPSNIQVTIGNGVPNFKIEWSGPTSGSYETSSNSYTITPVSAGEYTVRVTDASGCTKAQAVIIQSVRSDVNFTYESRAATCAQRGAIWLTIQDGSGPYNISWTGPSSGSSTSADAGVQITDLNAGVYAVTVEDKNGCSITQSIEVKNEGGSADVNFANKATPVTCNKAGEILLTMISGTAPYTVTWSGPTTGSRTASTTDIVIDNLSNGTYTVNVTGAGGCGMSTRVIEIEEKRIVLGINGTVTNGVCGGKGSVTMSWTGDRDPYTITWTGAAVGSTVINEKTLTLNNLKDGDYTFTVTGFDGCSGQYQATINNSGTSVNADFTYAINGRKLTFGNLSSAGTYSWNFGDGTTSSEMNPTHTYDKNGTYTICLTVTNDCGTKEKCQSVSISAATGDEPSAAVVLGDMSGAKGAVLQLPVRVENCTKLGTLSGTIKLGNDKVAKIMGLSPNAISPVYNDGNYSFSYLSSGTGMTITSETILFYVNVQLIGGVGASSTVDLSSLPVALELTCTENGFSPPITPEVGSGRVSISSNQVQLTEVGGNIKTYWGDGVVEAMVRIQSNDHEMASMTSVDGDYVADQVPMGYEYTIEPEKMSNPANGISTFGLFLTQKYILGYNPKEIVSPYQVIAMDANCSGTLTTFDLYVMQQMLIGNLTEFPGCNSWVFVDATHEFPEEFSNMNVFPYPSAHTMMLDKEDVVADFIGVKVGDVLGRALPNDAYANTVATDRNRAVMPLAIEQTTAKTGEVFEVTFRADDLTEMVSFQLGLDFDPTALELVEFVANTENELSSAIAGVNRNQLKISWYDPTGKATTLTPGEEFFKVKFVAKQNISNIEKLFSINNRTFAAELHESTSDAKRFELTVAPLKSAFKVYQNTPNPFMTATTIAIEMPQSMDAEITLHDHYGRTIQTINQTLEKGANQVEIARNNLSSGIYYYTVKAGDFVDTKRMLVVE